MLKADWRSFSEANLVLCLLTLIHLEEFEPTLNAAYKFDPFCKKLLKF